MLRQEEKLVELSNGCICCTLREDLLTSISSLAAESRFDHVLVESSGISEPLPVAETFTFRDRATALSLNDVASLHNLVTVVDAASIFEQLKSMDTLVDRGWQTSKADERTVAHLLCDQIGYLGMTLICGAFSFAGLLLSLFTRRAAMATSSALSPNSFAEPNSSFAALANSPPPRTMLWASCSAPRSPLICCSNSLWVTFLASSCA